MFEKFGWISVAVFIGATSAGCSSGSGAGNPNGGINQGSTGNFNCASACNKIMSVNCPDTSYGSSSDCIQECQQLFSQMSSSCQTLVANLENCFLKGTLSCSADGGLQSSSAKQCQAQAEAALPCLESSGGGSSTNGGTDTGGGSPAPPGG